MFPIGKKKSAFGISHPGRIRTIHIVTDIKITTAVLTDIYGLNITKIYSDNIKLVNTLNGYYVWRLDLFYEEKPLPLYLTQCIGTPLLVSMKFDKPLTSTLLVLSHYSDDTIKEGLPIPITTDVGINEMVYENGVMRLKKWSTGDFITVDNLPILHNLKASPKEEFMQFFPKMNDILV